MAAARMCLRASVRGGAVGAALLALATIGGCGGDSSSGDGDTVEPKLSAIEAKVFARSCGITSSCHRTDSPNPREINMKATMGLDLVPPVMSHIVNQPSEEVPGRMLVVPGNPDASYLLEKLTSATPAYGKRMPDMNPPLAPGVIAGIREWIRAGAKAD
jgi:hypothetical protein